jgi:hypothetical protein
MSDEPPRARAMECTVAEYAELERWCRAKILAALDRWQNEEISRRLATTPSPITKTRVRTGRINRRPILIATKYMLFRGQDTSDDKSKI